MLDTQNLGSFCHLVAPDSADALSNDGKIQRRIEDVAPLTAGQGDHQNPMALVGIARQGGRPLAGLIVRMGVDGHQPQFGHVSSARCVAVIGAIIP